MFETYKPSGRFSPAFFLCLIVGMLITIPAAYIYQLGLYWIPLIYVSVLLTMGMGFVEGAILSQVVRFGHCRNVIVAFLGFLLLASTALAAKYSFQYLRARGEIRQELARMTAEEISTNLNVEVPAESLEEFRQAVVNGYTLTDHLQQRIESGWQIGRAGGNNGNPVGGWLVYSVWAIEAGIIFVVSWMATLSAVKQPYSEKLGLWADESEVVMTLPITDEPMVEKIKSAKSVQELLELPIPQSDESNQFAVYTVSSVSGQEMEDAYLTVELQSHSVNSKGENEVKKLLLINNAILTADQRTQLTENAQIMNEAFAAYRESLEIQSAGATPQQPDAG